jgi:hypothetical protein
MTTWQRRNEIMIKSWHNNNLSSASAGPSTSEPDPQHCVLPSCLIVFLHNLKYIHILYVNFITFKQIVRFFVYFGLFRNRSVCFGCFETYPKHRNKPKNTFLVSRNKPKINRNRLCFGLFRFEPKNFFVCFEDTLMHAALAACKGNIY